MFKAKLPNLRLNTSWNLSILLLLLALPFFHTNPTYAMEKPPSMTEDIIRSVLFFSPNCGHCHIVMNEVLPPIKDKYGEQLEILLIDISTPLGRQLFQSAAQYFINQKEIRGVPTLVVGEQVLIGSVEIPEQFPALIEAGLTSGGVQWPAIPGLSEAIQSMAGEGIQEAAPTSAAHTPTVSSEAMQTPIPVSESTGGVTSSGSSLEVPIYLQRFLQDPVGNSIAVLTLAGMVVSIVVIGFYFLQTPAEESQRQPRALSWPSWAVPVLCLAGLGVAGYMSYVELNHVEAICGPLGDCNLVQQSPYATLWGFLPVGVLGMIGYVAIGTAWYLHRFGPSKGRNIFAISMWGMALLGTLFSVYLTFLEPFVIGATCAWCISSAILITMLLWATTGPAIQSVAQLTDID
jgi:uncharacterized membrane protein/thiol-disulfide isomerase/thioredoxin